MTGRDVMPTYVLRPKVHRRTGDVMAVRVLTGGTASLGHLVLMPPIIKRKLCRRQYFGNRMPRAMASWSARITSMGRAQRKSGPSIRPVEGAEARIEFQIARLAFCAAAVLGDHSRSSDGDGRRIRSTAAFARRAPPDVPLAHLFDPDVPDSILPRHSQGDGGTDLGDATARISTYLMPEAGFLK